MEPAGLPSRLFLLRRCRAEGQRKPQGDGYGTFTVAGAHCVQRARCVSALLFMPNAADALAEGSRFPSAGAFLLDAQRRSRRRLCPLPPATGSSNDGSRTQY